MEEKVKEEFISEEDRLKLEIAKVKKHNAILNAQKAMAQNETAELAFKYTVLQLYMKYGLGPNDVIDDNTGKIGRDSDEKVVEEKEQE